MILKEIDRMSKEVIDAEVIEEEEVTDEYVENLESEVEELRNAVERYEEALSTSNAEIKKANFIISDLQMKIGKLEGRNSFLLADIKALTSDENRE